ncbi:hypothetical protein WMY93_007014 [Mugilogobius chulae]|uniref:Uncharacterized protein n=1 Tax=Mugilogobius chulae TaxID=88201 RepID=A0AAW0PVX5_9GOBI
MERQASRSDQQQSQSKGRIWTPGRSLPRFTVLAPDVLRADFEENLVLQVYEASGPVPVLIEIWDYDRSRVLMTSSVTLDQDNGHHKLHSILLPSEHLQPGEKKEKFVYLKVTIEGFLPEEKLVLVSFHQGFIFIQTDKPIYKPADVVRFRAFVSSPAFKAAESYVMIDIKNPDGIAVFQTDRMRAPNGIFQHSFTLTEHANEGIWTVTAKFDHWEQNTFNSTFEVKKYVLPAFNVTLAPQKPFFSVDDNELVVSITARYLYGKPVQGKAFVMFGVKHEREKIRLKAMKQVTNLNGGTVSLTLSDLKAEYPNIRSLAGKSIYVKASVLTQSGSDLVEVEKSGIPIIISPYVLSFRDAPQYFKPGLPLDIVVDVRYHDGTPVHEVKVKVSLLDVPLTVTRGVARTTLNMPKDRTTQVITAETVEPGLRPEQQARKELRLKHYATPSSSQNLLYISGVDRRVTVGDHLSLMFTLSVEKPENRQHVKHVTYLVLNKGRILKSKRLNVASQVEIVDSLSVTPDMMPSFRVVAFYSLPWTREEEVVSDSIYVDVTDSCAKKVKVGPEGRYSDLLPGKTLSLMVQAEPGSIVSLVAVDNSVFLLRKDRLTQSKVWGVVQQADLGCSRGGGANAKGVFSDAGLLFFTNTGFKTGFRQSLQCPRSARWRRSADRLERKAKLERQYKDELLRRCCVDGLRDIPMRYSCTRRSLYITEGVECIRAFRDCCGKYRDETIDPIMPTAMPSFITTTTRPPPPPYASAAAGWTLYWGQGNRVGVRSEGLGGVAHKMEPEPAIEYMLQLPERMPDAPLVIAAVTMGRVDAEEEDEDWFGDEWDDEEDFDATMVDLRSTFQESWLWEDIPVPNKPDITTGLSSVTVERPLPDSITEWGIMAVSASARTGFCVAEPYNVRAWKPFFVDLKLPYSVARNEQVQIKAVVHNYLPRAQEARVTLMKTDHMCSVAFKDRHVQEVSIAAGSSVVLPFTVMPLVVGQLPIEIMVVTKDMMMTDRVQKTLRVVMEGVQKTKVWSVVLNPAAEGGNQILRMGKIELDSVVPNSVPETFINVRGNLLADSLENSLKQDSLAALIRMPGGCVEQNLASMSLPTIACLYLDRTNDWAKVGAHLKDEALGYIRKGYTNQLAYRKSDGSYPPYRKQGASTWITAFVVKVFSMAHSIIGIDEQQVCEPLLFLLKNRHKAEQGVFIEENPVYSTTMTGGLRGDDPQVTLTAFEVIRNTAAYLKKALQVPGRRPYTVAISSYALALLKDTVDVNPKQLLLRASSAADSENRLYTLEATGYALLALLKLDALTEAAPAFKWLNSQRRRGGGYGSTQPTVVVLQALSEYMIQQPPSLTLDLNVEVRMGVRSESYNFNPVTSYAARSARLPANVNLEVQAQGSGEGILEVVTYYNQLHEEDEKKPCEFFDLQVAIEESAEKSSPDVVKSYQMTIKVRALGPRDVRMVVLDVSLPTGFTPDNSDLDQLSNSVDRYIANFKIVDNLSDRGSLILHLFKVSHKEQEILIFKLQQNFKVGHIQPSSVSVYEYYNPDHRCSRSFTPRESTEELTQICSGNVCRCTQGQCDDGDCCVPKTDSENFLKKERETFACVTLHHVYKVKVLKVTESYYDKYELEITQLIKLGSESGVLVGETRTFMSHGSCRDGFKLIPNQEYLIIGPIEDQWNIDSATNRFVYLLGKDTWVERWPTEAECAGSTFRQKCESLNNMAHELSTNACRL